jgi:hypothetical protein
MTRRSGYVGWHVIRSRQGSAGNPGVVPGFPVTLFLLLVSLGMTVAADSVPTQGLHQGLSAFCTGDSEHIKLCVQFFNQDASFRTDTVAVLPADTDWSEPAVAVSAEGNVQLAWCYGGKVYYTSATGRNASWADASSGRSCWPPPQLLSPVAHGHAFSCSIETEGRWLFVEWQSRNGDACSGVTTWRRIGLLHAGERTIWVAPPRCLVSLNPEK